MAGWTDPFLPAGYSRQDSRLFCEGLPVDGLAARFGTPLYIYSRSHILGQLAALRQAFAGQPDVQFCYAVKANDAQGILGLLHDAGAGFDIVSGGELARALAVGADPDRIVFSGVGKTDDELRRAIAIGIGSVNLESPAEARRLAGLAAQAGRRVRVAVRVNPDVDPGTHPYIATGLRTSKFGVPMDEARALYTEIAGLPGLEAVGIACHIGSQLTQVQPILDALDRVLALHDDLAAAGINLPRIDMGGGLGIRYRAEDSPPDLAALAAGFAGRLAGRGLQLVLEPGRFLVGNAGLLACRVLYGKQADGRQLLVADAAMNDLMRPALYQAWHELVPVVATDGPPATVDLVGPVCESTDVLARQRSLPPTGPGDLLALLGAGAYGSVMGGTYNTRPRPAEVLVDGSQVAVLRPRERLEQILARDVSGLDWTGL